MSAARTVVLVGAGHVHLYVAARAGVFAAHGARLVLVAPGAFWYSGLATGMLAGQYDPADDQVDAKALIEAHGGAFVADCVAGVDAETRTLRLASGGTLAYDYLSLNVGSRVNAESIPGMADDPSVWPVKPVSNLWRLRRYLEAQFRARRVPRVAVLGGGPTGCEVAANLVALSRRHRAGMPISLCCSEQRLVGQAPAGAGGALRRHLEGRGVRLRLGSRIVRRAGSELLCDDGRRFEADIVVLATGLQANALVCRIGLPVLPREGLRVTPALHSIADRRVFAGGDCAALEGHRLPKLGVFGVRQAAYLHANLIASLRGRRLMRYAPQRRYLAIMNLGDGTGLSTWGRWWWRGRSSLWLKDSLDRRFLAGYRRQYTR